jgi:hypothetical protein
VPLAASDSTLDLVALTFVMEGRLTLADAVRALMARSALDRKRATDAVVRAAVFASDEYEGHPLDRQVAEAL